MGRKEGESKDEGGEQMHTQEYVSSCSCSFSSLHSGRCCSATGSHLITSFPFRMSLPNHSPISLPLCRARVHTNPTLTVTVRVA